MSFLANPLPRHDGLRAALDRAYRMDETEAVERLIAAATVEPEQARRVAARATQLVGGIRATRTTFGGIEAFLQEYGLSTREGIALMCVAEALLRIPDAETADLLIEDKIGSADWQSHLGRGETLFVNASTWALMLTGRVVSLDPDDAARPASFFGRMVKRLGEPVIRRAMNQAMRIMGRQFVMGRTIGEALDRAEGDEKQGYRHSYDMLGESARTTADAERYLEAYRSAIGSIGKRAAGRGVVAAPGISVKLSALDPRYDTARRADCVPALAAKLAALCRDAAAAGIGLCVDAEEAHRLDLSLDILERVAADRSLGAWQGLGLAIQAYQKRAYPLIDVLADIARRTDRRLMVRLVKGAYWDSEIKAAQEAGMPAYPVFTRKAATDVSYLACAKKLLSLRDLFYPAFATHNAQTVASVLAFAGNAEGFEFQRLHGMGEPLYDQIVGPQMPVRVYAPVGSHEDLLAYLVRRLLENGANTSFVNRLQDEQVPVEAIVADPVATMRALPRKPHPRIPLPVRLYGDDRRNSAGLDLSDPPSLRPALEAMEAAAATAVRAAPLVGGPAEGGGRTVREVTSPADRRRAVGTVAEATVADARLALDRAQAAFRRWNALGGPGRAGILERAADLLEARREAFMALAVGEAGKTIPDAIAEVREAVDFCRYYAARARAQFALPLTLAGPTGEDDSIGLTGRGVFVCISPWNFPLAIFMGQVAAALLAGNSVIAKPAEQTPLIAWKAVSLLHEAGVPADVLHLLPGDGPTLGGALLGDRRVAGVAFTGSTDTARRINRMLAERDGPIAPLIAETGGQNAMIVDSTALPEQVVGDVLDSAFRSAGQRCSALRVLCLQDSIADRTIAMLKGAAALLRVGDPSLLEVDVGPVIDAEAQAMLEAHAARMAREAVPLLEVPLGPAAAHGTFFAPRAFEIRAIDQLEGEVFGPVLHVVRWKAGELDLLMDQIEATGYGLTLGIHSRIERTVARIRDRLPVGNIYVNRNIIGAVVGVQPFGGMGLSGTGPKAGGPHYLQRFANEKTVSVNTAAAGGNALLVSLSEEEPAPA